MQLPFFICQCPNEHSDLVLSLIPKEPSNERPAAHGWVLQGRSSSSRALAADDHRPQGRSTSLWHKVGWPAIVEKHVGIICSNLFQDLRGSPGALMVRKRKQESAKAQGAGIVVLTKLQTTLLTSALQKEHLKVGIQKNPARIYVDVSENSGTPKSSHFNRVFHYKPSILGYPYYWKHPSMYTFFADFWRCIISSAS